MSYFLRAEGSAKHELISIEFSCSMISVNSRKQSKQGETLHGDNGFIRIFSCGASFSFL